MCGVDLIAYAKVKCPRYAGNVGDEEKSPSSGKIAHDAIDDRTTRIEDYSTFLQRSLTVLATTFWVGR
jgi:hypothetical protein